MRTTILMCLALAVSGCAMEGDIGSSDEDLSILPNYCPYTAQLSVACVNESHVVGTTPECNAVCVPQTAIDNSCNCRPIHYRWCRPGNICILLAEGAAPPSTDYELSSVRYACDRTGICPNYYWRIF